MGDVGEVWRKAREDRSYRERLEADPVAVLAGTELTDDELSLLDAALRGMGGSSSRVMFVASESAPENPDAGATGKDLTE